MSDLISRQNAIDALIPIVKSASLRNRNVYSMARKCLGAIEDVPSAERKGKWLRYGEDGYPNEEDTVFWQCDQCLEQYTGRTTRIPNYCPNCGARMRGEEDVD